MVKTIGNPLTWGAEAVGALGSGVGTATASLRGEAVASETPRIRRIGTEDIRIALRKGAQDFAAFRADVLFLCLFYPIVGLTLAYLTFHQNLLPLVFPLASGFALLGPLAALGLYEMSRRRERGEDPGWGAALGVFGSPAIVPLLALGAYLVAIFVIWLMVAHWIYQLTLGPETPASLGAFVSDTLTTGRGWAMIMIGGAVGFVFAALVLAISLVSFPLLLDRNVGLPTAVVTSVRAARANPGPVALWGLIVAAGLILGSIPVLLGLIVVLPILGHATWHLYRRIIAPAQGA